MSWSQSGSTLRPTPGWASCSALIGLVIAGAARASPACAGGWLYPPVLSATSVIYAIPSLALFVVLIDYTGLADRR